MTMYKDESELFELSADLSNEDTISKLDEAAESLEISSLELDVNLTNSFFDQIKINNCNICI